VLPAKCPRPHRPGSESAQTIATAVEQLSTSIQSIAGSSDAVNATSKQTGEAAMAGRQIVSRTADEMKSIAEVVDASSRSVNELGQQSQEIATIANVIREIADQTNLLALNAAIEAARAGEQGRGFAVVADEGTQAGGADATFDAGKSPRRSKRSGAA
jgi:methyl-accepting chemotaxis protein